MRDRNYEKVSKFEVKWKSLFDESWNDQLLLSCWSFYFYNLFVVVVATVCLCFFLLLLIALVLTGDTNCCIPTDATLGYVPLPVIGAD